MKEFLLSSPAQAIIWSAALLIVIALGGFIVGIYRGRAGQDSLSANELLTNFRDLHHQGDIDDAEFRTIKTVLAPKLQRELKETEGES